MKVLVACEFSGVVREAFRKKGHDAWSCDLLPARDSSPYHYQGPIEEFLKSKHSWDLMVAHPPCTYLTVSGNRWYANRPELIGEAYDFFIYLSNLFIPKICIENPVGRISTLYRKPDQIVQPYWFGDPFEKKTCLWLSNLPLLTPTNMVEPPPRQQVKGGKTLPTWYSNAPKKDRSMIRSTTFQGLANAMADQWG